MQPADALDPPHGFLGRFFGRKVPDAGPLAPRERARLIAGSPAAERAAGMLAAPAALLQLNHREARKVVTYMLPHRIAAGTKFIREGDVDDTGFTLLVLDGEVTIENAIVNRSAPVTATVLGPGSLIGEMGLLDGGPRSASCIALTDVRCAVLTREALNQLLDDEPRTAAKLMMAISLRIAKRMRDNQDKLKLYAQLTQALNEEINALLPH
ncbi:cyclic nucleotide-binding domain-containing protein [Caenimonas aquaedulcis]|uniref:Cyclic nucleotide-binding domain-containing protein n=1 Tax=Caenimonas aquaedulcis TaxID=2793270 RepID=A0A931MHN6_9BURK|nr:cyclic nucleotide-binding domain-containing protein [Caenimonas aquaedulcis]MBG9389132.1 cyclic nucleotide-binding domain-containing protein [Caenimonas aquaedulcis]